MVEYWGRKEKNYDFKEFAHHSNIPLFQMPRWIKAKLNSFLDDTVEQLLLPDGHLPRSLFRSYVFISHEMENPMDHQEGDHFHFVQTKSFHLAPSCLN